MGDGDFTVFIEGYWGMNGHPVTSAIGYYSLKAWCDSHNQAKDINAWPNQTAEGYKGHRSNSEVSLVSSLLLALDAQLGIRLR